jgi:virginiamycin B lyase
MRNVARLRAGLIGAGVLLAIAGQAGVSSAVTSADAATALGRPVASRANVALAVPGRARRAARNVERAEETSGRAAQRSEQAAVTEIPAKASVVGSITVYPDKGGYDPIGIAAGSDGALWYTIAGGDLIGRITTAGVITHYKASGLSRPFGIAAGSDGALWFTNGGDPGSIGRITTSGRVTFFTDRRISEPDWIAAGPHGTLWFTNESGGGYTHPSIERITTHGALTTFTAPSISEPAGIAAGPDGAMWFVNSVYPGSDSGSIGRITTSGKVTKYTYPGSFQPSGITAGPDDAMWFTNGNPSSIERITTSGVVTDFANPDFGQLGGDYLGGGGGIVKGPDGALWFTDYGAPVSSAGLVVVGRMTSSGVLTAYVNPGSSVQANEIAAGPDNALWFTMGTAGIGRVSTLAFTSGPKLSSPPRVGRADTCLFASLDATSSTVSWLLNGAVQKGMTGRSFTPSAADLSRDLSCSVTLVNSGGSLTKKSASVKVAVGAALKVVRKPALSGPDQAGKAESVTSGSWSPGARSYGYQWYLGSSKVTGATSSQYRPPAGDKGKKLHCVVAAHRPGYASGRYTTKSVTLS